jgi:hypothetical protein
MAKDKRDKLLNNHKDAFTAYRDHSQEITKEKIKSLLPKGSARQITDELMDLLRNMERDTGLPQNLLEQEFLGYIHLLRQHSTISLKELANAVKFCNLKRNYSNKQAWSIVFPDKYKELVDKGAVIDNYVNMYNTSKLVVSIEKEMLIPISIQYAPYFHAATKMQFDIMNGQGCIDKDGNQMNVSPMVRHLAAKELAALTKPIEEAQLNIKINPGEEAVSMQQEMNAQLKALVDMQKKRLENGEDIVDVQEIGINFDEVGTNGV